MLEKLKRFITVGGWKSIAGAALIAYAAYLSGPTCVDISCSQHVAQLHQWGESLLGVGLAHKLVKLGDTLRGIMGEHQNFLSGMFFPKPKQP